MLILIKIAPESRRNETFDHIIGPKADTESFDGMATRPWRLVSSMSARIGARMYPF
jgi:hypothetical protein